MIAKKKSGVGELNETSLHAALKTYLAQPGDKIESPVGPYIIDILRGSELIEIQTRGFTQIRKKLGNLLSDYSVTLVYPISVDKWLVRMDENGKQISRRKSPRRGQIEDMFYELVHMPRLAVAPNLTLNVLTIQEEVILQPGTRGSWRRRGWEIADRRLLSVLGENVFANHRDYLQVLPTGLPDKFTNADLAELSGCRKNLAGKISYTLQKMQVIEQVGKDGRYNLYQVCV